MKNKVQIFLVFIYIGVLAYVITSQLVTGLLIAALLSLLISAGITYLIRNKINGMHFSRIFLIGTFLLIISIPISGRKETASYEKRTLAPAPVFHADYIWGYFFAFQKYFEDRFAFRNRCVEWIGKFKFHYLKSSPVPSIVGIGKDNWLFFTGPDVLNNACTNFTPEELKRIKLNLQIITKWFDLRGIKYYITIAPFKSRIYPEMMQPDLKYKFRISKIAQLYDYLKSDTSIRLIDVSNELMEGKKIRPTYIKTDTHWNEFGAFLAYEKIMKRVVQDFPQINYHKAEDYQIDSIETNAGDIQLMMGFTDEIYFMMYQFKLKSGVNPIIVDSSTIRNPDSRNSIRKMPKKVNGLKLFVVRDSFTEYLRIFLTPNFDRTFLAWMPTVPVARVVEEKSDLIIHEMLEQFIMFNLILPPEIEADTAFLKTYFPTYEKLAVNP